MKTKLLLGFASAILAGTASANFYYVGTEAQESLPLKWIVGADFTYDDNVNPGALVDGEEAFSVNPYIGLSFVTVTPQTTLDVYARLGVIYYIDQPDGNVDDTYGQARVGANLTHSFNERLRFVSRNFLTYELEPDYTYGYSTGRQNEEYFYWDTDNALGYRWTERFATYTGIQLNGLNYSEVENQDRFTWSLYNQFRYQVGPVTVLTVDYRYSETKGDGFAADSTDQFLLAGVEHRFSPTGVLIAKAGAQFHDVDGGEDAISPFFEVTVNSQLNEQASVRAFARYSLENYDTVQNIDGFDFLFSERKTFRIGVAGDYQIAPKISLYGGVDYIPATYDEGQWVFNKNVTEDGLDEDIFNAYLGVSFKFTDFLSASVSYNYTDSSSDIQGKEYDRSRVSVGVRAEF